MALNGTPEHQSGAARFLASTHNWAAALSLGATLAVAVPAAAQDASCKFYSGKTVELVVPYPPGTGFDAYGRLLAKYMAPELGAENMIVRNQPGAGGMLATNQVWATEPDGLTIQVISANGSILADLVNAEGVAFEIAEFSWIGRIAGDPDILLVSPPQNINTIGDVKRIAGERNLRVGSSGPGDIDYVEALLFGKMFDVKVDVITGFSTAVDIFPLLARGEVDMLPMSLSSGDAAVKSESAQIRWVVGTEEIPGRPDVRPLSEFVDEEYLPVLKVHESMVQTGRAIAGPPNIPADRLKCLRDAYDRALANQQLIDESIKINRPVAHLGGEEMLQLVKNASNAPNEYVDLVLESFGKK